jgi:hypothetical protein
MKIFAVRALVLLFGSNLNLEHKVQSQSSLLFFAGLLIDDVRCLRHSSHRLYHPDRESPDNRLVIRFATGVETPYIRTDPDESVQGTAL